jgi:hypothetical protein
LLLPPRGGSEAELPLLIELDGALAIDVFALVGVVPLIGVMLPELLGVVMPALEALPLLGLLLRGMNSPPDTVEEDEPRDFPAVSSSGVIEEF